MKDFHNPMMQADFIPKPRNTDIEETIRCGQQYMNTHVPHKTSIVWLFFEQIHYISPLLLLTQFIALVLLIVMAFAAQDMNYETAKNIMLFMAVLTAIFAVPEFFKDVSCGLLEIEMTCKNSSASIFFIRLIIIGFINITMITLFSYILATRWELRFLSVILYGLVPVNTIYIFNFLLFRFLKISSRIAALSCSILTAIIIYILSTRITLIQSLSESAWFIIFTLTTIIFIGQCINEVLYILKRQGVYYGISN